MTIFHLAHLRHKVLGTRPLLCCVWVLTICCSLFSAHVVFAADATLFLSPIAGTASIGDTFPIRIYLSTDGAQVNAVEGTLSFDPSIVEVTSLSTDGSALSSWTTPPSFDNASGTVVWSGIAPADIAGQRLFVMGISIRFLHAGEATLHFDSGAAVHAADGAGTNVLVDMKSGVYTGVPHESLPVLNEDHSAPEETAVATHGGEVLGTATGTDDVITSSTHPDPDGWGKGDASFLWTLHGDELDVRTGIDRSPRSNPLKEFTPPISSRDVPDLEDGVWYFHLARDFPDGTTILTHRRIQVDSVSPEISDLSILKQEDDTDPSRTISLTATDTLSGVERTEITLDGTGVQNPEQLPNGSYRLVNLTPGDHTVEVRVFDRAGNMVSRSATLSIQPLPPPEIRLVTESPREGKDLVFSGHASPGTTVHIALLSAGDTQPVVEEVSPGSDGTFTHTIAFKPQPGSYTFWANAGNTTGARSSDTEKKELVVKPSFVGMVKRHPFIPVAGAGLLVLLGLIWWGVRRYLWHRNIENIPKEEGHEGTHGVHDIQTNLRTSVLVRKDGDEEDHVKAHTHHPPKRPEVSGGVIRLQ